MLYKKLAQLYEELSGTTKRLEKINILSKFLEYLHVDEKDVLYLLTGDIYPNHDERKIGISNQITIKAISKATGTETKKIIQGWKKIGDLGKVAEEFTKNKKQSTLQSHVLTTEKVLENLRKLPEMEGKGTVDKKISLITELLTSASSLEAKYLTRTLIGDLRIGIQESTIKEAISSAFFEKTKEASEKIQKAIDRSNDIAKVFEIAGRKKLKDFEKVSLEAGNPIKAMLAQKVATIEDGFKALGKPCAIEYKYDGFRLIIHKKENKIILFTRRLENVTKQFPEVVEYTEKYVKGNSFILDAEAVGFDRKTKRYLPFQSISQRIRRKYHIEKLCEEFPVEINVFDVLYHNGKSLLDESFEKRTALIKKVVQNQPYKIISAKQIITDDEKKAEEFYKKSLEENQEGVMMKSLSAVYQPGSRVGQMLKIKPEDRDLDLVITGAEYGTGKRSGWLSSFILSCRDDKFNNENEYIKNSKEISRAIRTGRATRDLGGQENPREISKEEYLEIGKVGTGISEKEGDKVTFDELTKLINPLIIEEKGREVKIKPKIVVAVVYQEIQKSPNYNSGFALRFPRVTALRPDKPLSEIATLKEIEKEFERQGGKIR